MLCANAMDDGALWEAFATSSLPGNLWTHEAHVRTAWLFLQRNRGLDEAHLLMRIGIVRLNAFHGLVETPARGYHETLTRVWLVLVGSKMETLVADDSAAFFAA